MKTIITGTMPASALAEFSEGFNNWGSSEPIPCNEKLFYMSSISVGGRELRVEGLCADFIRDYMGSSSEDGWYGFEPSQVVWARWTSATSGASIELIRLEGGDDFSVLYHGAESSQGGESWYASALAAHLTNLEVIQVGDYTSFDELVEFIAA